MFKGEGIEDGVEERYAALGFWKTANSVELDFVKKKPQSYGWAHVSGKLIGTENCYIPHSASYGHRR
jgi:hypothetical protein